MSHYCNNCGTEIKLEAGQSVGRQDCCDKCGADLRCCYNCEFYDASAYNECRESQAERVLDKDRSNYCDFFRFGTNAPDAKKGKDKKSGIDALDDLFK